MNPVSINNRPTTTGPILNPQLHDANEDETLNILLAAALELAETNVKECYSAARQLDPTTYRHVEAQYPKGEIWRYCAVPALTTLVDALRTITRDIPEAHRDLAFALEGEIISPDRTALLTDEAQLATGYQHSEDAK